MSDGAPPNDAIGELAKAMPGVADNARSLDEIAAWLRAQPGVESVELGAYLLKSNPPQRDFLVECKRRDGSTVRKVLNVYVLSGDKFRFNCVRDP
jgi:hypothetical protein